MTTPRIVGARLEQLRITERTIWSFVRLASEDGLIGWGEATLPAEHATLRAAATVWFGGIEGLPAERGVVADLSADRATLPAAALRSALDMALYDLEGRRTGRPVRDLLGPRQRAVIPLYANINRATRDRAPQGFAATAERARRQGYTAFKLAPFDEVTSDVCESPAFDAALSKGLARIDAARAAVGAGATLRVDCHWRFTPGAAERLIDACVPFGLDWIECPIAETVDRVEAVAALRQRANRRGIRLAGLESGIGIAAFAPFLAGGAYDVVMPDVKYLGGLDAFGPLAALAREHGAIVSPHNPTGPICHAASLQVCATLPQIDTLEIQFDETPLFDGLVGGPVSDVTGGRAGLPDRSGLGVAIDERCAETVRIEDAP